MNYYYLDANVVVKYYLDEPASTWVRQLIEARDVIGRPAHVLFSAMITITEVSAAIGIIQRVGRISKRQRDIAFKRFMNESSRYQFIPVTDSLLVQAANLAQQHPLKAYDAVQLAGALFIKARVESNGHSLTFISGDKQLLRAAQAEGLHIDNPFDHTDLDP